MPNQRLQGRFGSSHGRVVGDGSHGAQAGNGDNPSAVCPHQLDRVLRKRQQGGGVDVHRVVEVLQRELESRLQYARGGVADQDVQPAETLADFVEHALHVFFLAHVGAQDQRPGAALLDRLGSFRSRCFVPQVVDGHIRPRLGQAKGDGPADSPRPARDQSRFPLQVNAKIGRHLPTLHAQWLKR